MHERITDSFPALAAEEEEDRRGFFFESRVHFGANSAKEK